MGLCLSAQASAFGLEDVIARAETLAAEPYQAPDPIPGFMQNLGYDEFRSIRFDPAQQLWSPSRTRFQVMLVPAGRTYRHPVRINIVDAEGVHLLPFRKELFSFGDEALRKKVPADLGYAGFKLTYPINKAGVQDQFLVFAGASYFRGVGAGDHFGLSKRGLALDTGLLSGEEFPIFREFWLIRPHPQASSMKVYGLLDSKRVTGAYEFTIHPGQPTRVEINSTLFTRERIELLGIAPLTSMFFYGENTARPLGNWRPEVHDSDGLLIHDGSGEWSWRPLINPTRLQTFSFSTRNVRGFGLFQRDGSFASYQDPEADYERRPDAWVRTREDWGDGRIVLVQIPTSDETNDNIVAFWSPPNTVAGGKRFDFRYEIDLGRLVSLDHPLARVQHTFVGLGDILGGGDVENAYRLIADFQGGPLEGLAADAPVTADVTAMLGGRVLEQYVEYVEQNGHWRLSILAMPAEGKPLELRAYLKRDATPLSETWTYTLPTENDIKGNGK
ncbi:glucan biosynthesis protein G [Thiohalobacter thiocyanaticus]|uniref:Glucans biosynthesis protein G n=2 Tax=Thiohalobacter thiocyanaticus TaxID=585455 RepID=A0A1Z4VME9_9GAMM|nr:glucan biosynthesis protein G [Thiohalobacter thiocyanaticus]